MMANIYKENLLQNLRSKYGLIKAILKSQSLFCIENLNIFLYFRYSKISKHGKCSFSAFYGLRFEDLKFLQGKKAYIIFLSDNADKNIVLPFANIEALLSYTKASLDGQYKTHIFYNSFGIEIYIAGFGKFKADSYLGFESLFDFKMENLAVPELSHTNAQELLGAIAISNGFNVFYPAKDIEKLDNKIVDFSKIKRKIPYFGEEIQYILIEIDCIWFECEKIISLFEVEHSTPVYSGLLHFNDVLLSIGNINNFNIVANKERENKFYKEINRPTFKQNNLIDKVSFMDYSNLYHWYLRLKRNTHITR